MTHIGINIFGLRKPSVVNVIAKNTVVTTSATTTDKKTGTNLSLFIREPPHEFVQSFH